MYLKSLSFSKIPTNGEGWSFMNCIFNNINLIAGKNASGKTRLLKATNTLVRLLLNDKVKTQNEFELKWELNLQDAEDDILYEFSYKKGQILNETLKINNTLYLTRDDAGKGFIRYEGIEQDVDFEVEKDKIVIASKRDKKQHPFLEKIFKWANSVFLYTFSSQLGRNTLMAIKQELELNEDELAEITKDDEGVVPKFELGCKRFGKTFKEKVIEDFNKLGYSLEDIDITTPPDFTDGELKGFPFPFPLPNIIYVVEKGVKDKIFQGDISQGMFRVLSLIIQITYLEFNLESSYTILIDDIGEGLDFERATKVIKFLVEKAEKLEGKLQLVMTTNDRFVMNNVPLKYWTVVDRANGKINFYSQKTHRELFERFQEIGLNNFDFFSGEYYKNEGN